MIKDRATIDKEIERLNKEIQELNDACAEALGEITGAGKTRVLSYTQETELNETINYYTKKLAKLIVDLEELEDERKNLE